MSFCQKDRKTRSLSWAVIVAVAATGNAAAAAEPCELAPYTVTLKRGKKVVKIELPAKGSFVQESHYLTTLDKLPNRYPSAMKKQPENEHAIQCDEGVKEHLQRSIKIYQRFKPDATISTVYPMWWQNVWTPEEGGHCGQGSIGDAQLDLLTPEAELWFLTMMWKDGTKPKPGTRFLLTYKKKSLVVVAGFETGPRERKFLGGVTPEVHDWLGIKNGTRGVSLGYLKDQSLAPGPINCRPGQ